MKNLKNDEKLMMLRARRANPEYETAFNKMLTVFRYYDDRECTVHCKIINRLYNVNRRAYTYDRIARDAHISDNALRRYRTTYADWFVYFLQSEPQTSLTV